MRSSVYRLEGSAERGRVSIADVLRGARNAPNATAPTSPSDSITFTDRVRMAGPAIGFALPTPPFLQGDSPRRLLSQAPRLSPIPEIGSSQQAETNTSTQQSEPRLGSPPSLVPEYDSSPPLGGRSRSRPQRRSRPQHRATGHKEWTKAQASIWSSVGEGPNR